MRNPSVILDLKRKRRGECVILSGCTTERISRRIDFCWVVSEFIRCPCLFFFFIGLFCYIFRIRLALKKDNAGFVNVKNKMMRLSWLAQLLNFQQNWTPFDKILVLKF